MTKTVLRLPANVDGTDYIIGDIHGHRSMVNKLLTTVQFDPKIDRLFSVGDLIDRGPQSAECLINVEKHQWFYAVRGNHEQMMIDDIRGGHIRLWQNDFGKWSKNMLKADILSMVKLADSLPHIIVVGEGKTRFNILHGEFYGNDFDLDFSSFDDYDIARLLHGRTIASGRYPTNGNQGLSKTFVGHTYVSDIKEKFNHVFLDTGGCFNDGKLTIYNTKTGQYVSVKHENKLSFNELF